jgi:DNA (cytosine-5)-methyltransferase 1
MANNFQKTSPEFEDGIDLINDDLRGTAFEGSALSVYTHFVSSGQRFPYVTDETFKKLSQLGTQTQVKGPPNFRFIDLFAGIGGFRLGLEKTGGEAVFASEWDKQACSVYFENHGEYPFGDINSFTNTEVSDNELNRLIPDHELLAGGFPCQPFSLAGVSARNSRGVSHGFECQTQGTLFFSIERIARVKRPNIIFLENVKNLVGHDGGNTFKVIQESIESLGYRFFWKLVDSQTVVPQRRVRCFMVAVNEKLVKDKGEFTFPTLPETPLPLASILEESPSDLYTITDKLWRGHKERTRRNLERGTGFTATLADISKPSNTIVARYGKDGKECLVPQENKNPRYLTISECRKLFGYPNDFLLPTKRTPAYRLLGNSVVLPLIERISDAIVSQYLS